MILVVSFGVFFKFNVQSVLSVFQFLQLLVIVILGNSPCDVLLLAGTGPEALELQLFSLKPKAGLVLKYYPAIELAKRKTTKGVATFKLGTKKPSVSYPDTKHYPFEKLGYIPNNKGQYES